MEKVRESQFGERIQFLLDTPTLATSNLGYAFGEVHPNCWGTVVYVIDGNERMKELWAGHDLETGIDALGDFIRIPQDNAPGYIGGDPMELFLAAYPETTPSPDTIISFYWDDPFAERCGFLLRHAGIFLGDVIFHQPGKGKPFALETIDDYVAYISKKIQQTHIEIKYHAVTSRSV